MFPPVVCGSQWGPGTQREDVELGLAVAAGIAPEVVVLFLSGIYEVSSFQGAATHTSTAPTFQTFMHIRSTCIVCIVV